MKKLLLMTLIIIPTLTYSQQKITNPSTTQTIIIQQNVVVQQPQPTPKIEWKPIEYKPIDLPPPPQPSFNREELDRVIERPIPIKIEPNNQK